MLARLSIVSFIALFVTILASLSISYAFELDESINLPSETLLRMRESLHKPYPEPVNCWGIALWAQGFIRDIRPAFKTEILNIFKENRCRKLSPKETPIAGDFGNFFNSSRGIYHTFIHLKGSWVFQKASPDFVEVPMVVNVDDQFKDYPIKFDLKTGCKNKLGEECFWGVVNYRCETKNIPIPHEAEMDFKFDPLFEKIETCSIPGSSCKQEFIDSFQKYISFLSVGLSQPSLLSSGYFRAIGKILLFLKENEGVYEMLPQSTLQGFVQVTSALMEMEGDTFKKLEDFPDFSKVQNQ